MILQKRYSLAKGFILFSICCLVYLLNDRTISAPDTVPNTLLAFNLFENHTLNFDNFRSSYFFKSGSFPPLIESSNGHLTSAYPIGTAIVTSPFYLCFYIYLKLSRIPVELTSESFEIHRLFFEKLAATLTTSLSIVIFYFTTRLKFNKSVCLISTFIFAFATSTWTTSSQGLWQHGISNLTLIVVIYCLLRANREEKSKKLLLTAGIFCGLLPGIRPTSTLFALTAIVYSIFTYHRKSWSFFVGFLSVLLSIVWNLYYFQNFSGGYTKLFIGSPYLFEIRNFLIAFTGVLVSPSRGLLIFSPILIYSCVGAYAVFKLRAAKDEKLIAGMTIAAFFIVISYGFYIVWWAGHSYGPRFMVDILPVSCYLINYAIAGKPLTIKRSPKFKTSFLFCLLLIISLFNQVVGAFGNTGVHWNSVPVDSAFFSDSRFWQVRDSQIERHTKALYYRVNQPSVNNLAYIQGLNGQIKGIQDVNNQTLSSITISAGERIFIKAPVVNTGNVNWYGYESAISRGEVRVRGILFDTNNQTVNENRLYIYGITKPRQVTSAIGIITFPSKIGNYQLVFDLVAEGITDFSKSKPNSLLKLNVNVVGKFWQEIEVIEPVSSASVKETIILPVTIRNTSNFTWESKGKNPVNLSYHWLDDNGNIIVFDGERTSLSHNLPPQQVTRVDALIKLPETPGNYMLSLSMVQEGVAWFSDTDNPTTVSITVNP